MPVPASINDLSTVAGSNSPLGSETPTTGDDYLRAQASFVAQLRDKLNGTSATGTAKSASVVGGLNFTNSAVVGSTTLDWYEEGTSTLTAVGSTTAGVASSYTAQTLVWQRIGNSVRGTATIAWGGGHTGTGDLQIAGFPYAASAAGSSFFGTVFVSGGSRPMLGTIVSTTQSGSLGYFTGTGYVAVPINTVGLVIFDIFYQV